MSYPEANYINILYIGGLFGQIGGTIKNCHSSGTINVTGNVFHCIGGFSATFLGDACYDCTSRMNIVIDKLQNTGFNDVYYIGGFSGESTSTSKFYRCASLGDISIGNASSTITSEKPVYISGFGNAKERAEYYDCVRSGKILFNGKVESPYISINGFALGYKEPKIKAVRCICYNEYDFGYDLIRRDDSHSRYHNPMFGYLDKGETQNYWGNKSYYYWTQIGDQLSSSKKLRNICLLIGFEGNMS